MSEAIGLGKPALALISPAASASMAVEHVGKTSTPALKREGGSVLFFVDLTLYSSRLELMLLI